MNDVVYKEGEEEEEEGEFHLHQEGCTDVEEIARYLNTLVSAFVNRDWQAFRDANSTIKNDFMLIRETLKIFFNSQEANEMILLATSCPKKAPFYPDLLLFIMRLYEASPIDFYGQFGSTQLSDTIFRLLGVKDPALVICALRFCTVHVIVCSKKNEPFPFPLEAFCITTQSLLFRNTKNFRTKLVGLNCLFHFIAAVTQHYPSYGENAELYEKGFDILTKLIVESSPVPDFVDFLVSFIYFLEDSSESSLASSGDLQSFLKLSMNPTQEAIMSLPGRLDQLQFLVTKIFVILISKSQQRASLLELVDWDVVFEELNSNRSEVCESAISLLALGISSRSWLGSSRIDSNLQGLITLIREGSFNVRYPAFQVCVIILQQCHEPLMCPSIMDPDFFKKLADIIQPPYEKSGPVLLTFLSEVQKHAPPIGIGDFIELLSRSGLLEIVDEMSASDSGEIALPSQMFLESIGFTKNDTNSLF